MLFKVLKTSQTIECNLWVSSESDPEVSSSSEYFSINHLKQQGGKFVEFLVFWFYFI